MDLKWAILDPKCAKLDHEMGPTGSENTLRSFSQFLGQIDLKLVILDTKWVQVFLKVFSSQPARKVVLEELVSSTLKHYKYSISHFLGHTDLKWAILDQTWSKLDP